MEFRRTMPRGAARLEAISAGGVTFQFDEATNEANKVYLSVRILDRGALDGGFSLEELAQLGEGITIFVEAVRAAQLKSLPTPGPIPSIS